MPDPDLAAGLRQIARSRAQVSKQESDINRLEVTLAGLETERERLLGSGAAPALLTRVTDRIERTEATLADKRRGREDLLGGIVEASDRLADVLDPARLVGTLDGKVPVAMLPVRLETRFASETRLRIRVFPDQCHIDGHDPALTAAEIEGGTWYWEERRRPGVTAAEVDDAWRALTSRFRPGRAAYVVEAMTPTNASGPPTFPRVPRRAHAFSRAPEATALPDRFFVVGLARTATGWGEVFRSVGKAVPDRLAAGPSPRMEQPGAKGQLPQDDALLWVRDPKRAAEQGMLIEVEHSALRRGVERLVVLGVDWTKTPAENAEVLQDLLDAQRYGGHLGLVAQGTPTNNTSDARSGFTSSADAETEALAPTRVRPPTDAWSAGNRLASALGLDPAVFAGVPGAEDREQAWSSALTDVLWRASAGYYLSDMLDPIADDLQLDADLRDFTAQHVFAGGPLPTLRVGAQPYGVLPVVARRRYAPGRGRAEQVVHRVAGAFRDIVGPAIAQVPHLRRAGEDQDVDETLLKLLQRTPVPWTMRFRPITGPVARQYVSLRWDIAAKFQQSWTAAMWVRLGEYRSTRLNELSHGKDHPLRVPLVAKPPDGETSYLSEIADLMTAQHGRLALNLREDSIALLEALAACSAVMELDRAALNALVDWLGTAADLSTLPALRKRAVPTPSTVRVETTPQRNALDFATNRALADAVVPEVSGGRPLGEHVTLQLADKLADFAALLRTPTDPHYWLGRQQAGLRELAAAPADRLEWAFRGWLDLFSTRLDAWFTGLATSRLASHRGQAPTGVHLGCWGVVEGLGHDRGALAESAGYVHTPSLAHATSTALLRNGRLANVGDDGKLFDLQITSDRVRRGKWLLDGVAQGQRLAALLGYRIERRLREEGLELMRYQLPLRRTAPLRGPQTPPDAPVEVLAARDVVDGVTLLDRWARDREAVLAAVAEQAQANPLPAGDRSALAAVLDDVYDSYDAVSDLLVAESVHQAALGNLERSGAALAAHDRHGRAPDLEYVESPRSGHTFAHRVAVVLQDSALPQGWRRDARGNAEPRMDAWVATFLGDPAGWGFRARLQRPGRAPRELTPVTLTDLGIGPLSVALATQRPGGNGPSELEQRVALAFAAQLREDPDAELQLLDDGPRGSAGGLADLSLVAGWLAAVVASPALEAGDLASTADIAAGVTSPGSADLRELRARSDGAVAGLRAARTALRNATTPAQRTRALTGAAPYDGPDALPRVPAGHPGAAQALATQRTEVLARLDARLAAAQDLASAPLPAEEPEAVARLTEVVKLVLGAAQPFAPQWLLSQPAPVKASLADRAALVKGDPAAVVSWLHQSSLVRPSLEPLASLLADAEAGGRNVEPELRLCQLPRIPQARWLALPFDQPPPHGSVAVVMHAPTPFEPGRGFAGLLVDAWTETVPEDTTTTGLTFHYDAPGSRAPQAILLAVHPDVSPGRWDFETLLDTVVEAVDLAQLRTLSAAELAPLGSFLPALYLPDDYTHDVPSVSFRDLVTKASAHLDTAALSTVLGKA